VLQLGSGRVTRNTGCALPGVCLIVSNADFWAVVEVCALLSALLVGNYVRYIFEKQAVFAERYFCMSGFTQTICLLDCDQLEEAEEMSAGTGEDLRVVQSQQTQGTVVQRTADSQV